MPKKIVKTPSEAASSKKFHDGIAGRPKKNQGIKQNLEELISDPNNRKFYRIKWNAYMEDFPDLNNSADADSLHLAIMELIHYKKISQILDQKPELSLDKDTAKIRQECLDNFRRLLETLKGRRADRSVQNVRVSIVEVAANVDLEIRENLRKEQELEEEELLIRLNKSKQEGSE